MPMRAAGSQITGATAGDHQPSVRQRQGVAGVADEMTHWVVSQRFGDRDEESSAPDRQFDPGGRQAFHPGIAEQQHFAIDKDLLALRCENAKRTTIPLKQFFRLEPSRSTAPASLARAA